MIKEGKFFKLLMILFFIGLPIDAALPKLSYIGSPMNLLAIIMIIYILFFLLKKNRIDKPPKMLILYYVYFMLSLLVGLLQGISLLSGLSLFLYGLLIILFFMTGLELNYRLVKNSFIISILIIGMYLILNLDVIFNHRLYIDLGSTMDPNYFSANLLIVNFVFLYSLGNKDIKRKETILTYCLILLVIFIVFLTGSRGGALAHLFLVVTFSIIKINFKNFLKICIVGIISFYILRFTIIDNISPHIINRFSISTILESDGTGRFNIWKQTLDIFSSGNLYTNFFGYGLGTTQIYTMNNLANHNSWLQSLFEGGIFGFTIWTLFIFTPLIILFKERNYDRLILLISIIIVTLSLDFHFTRVFWFSTFIIYKESNRIKKDNRLLAK